MAEIIQNDEDGDDILHQVAEPVPEDAIDSDRIQQIIADMKEALAGEEDGVAIAAPQIGEPVRIFVVAGRVFERERDKEEADDRVYINPKIVTTSSDTEMMEEGCLSCRWWYGNVERATKAKVRALDEDGNAFTEGASGLLAQIFQHETDHLDGTLFLDKAVNLHERKPQAKNDE